MNAYPYDETAADIAAALRQESSEAQEAYRYLFARVALTAGILELVALEAGETQSGWRAEKSPPRPSHGGTDRTDGVRMKERRMWRRCESACTCRPTK